MKKIQENACFVIRSVPACVAGVGVELDGWMDGGSTTVTHARSPFPSIKHTFFPESIDRPATPTTTTASPTGTYDPPFPFLFPPQHPLTPPLG